MTDNNSRVSQGTQRLEATATPVRLVRGIASPEELAALVTILAAASPFVDEISLDVPVTIAWAARDLVLPPWQAEIAKEVLPHAEHIMMRGVGHVPMYDDPEYVAKVLLRGSAPTADVAHLSVVEAVSRPRRRVAAATA